MENYHVIDLVGEGSFGKVVPIGPLLVAYSVQTCKNSSFHARYIAV